MGDSFVLMGCFSSVVEDYHGLGTTSHQLWRSLQKLLSSSQELLSFLQELCWCRRLILKVYKGSLQYLLCFWQELCSSVVEKGASHYFKIKELPEVFLESIGF